MLRSVFDLDSQQESLTKYEKIMADPSFWSLPDKQSTIDEVKKIKLIIDPWQNILLKMENIKELYDIILEIEDDIESIEDLAKEVEALKEVFSGEELKIFLGQEEDSCNAFLSINAGAGGTESCDWVSILLRMYQRWAEKKDFSIKTIDFLAGEEAGIKNIVILIEGPYAYGYLRSEIGVHRLVRISPFDSNKRRHTSFASIDVTPEINDNIDVNIEENELRIDTYRSGGAGGQHVNKTDSAVRITHLPTGIVVQCQNERSQHKNKASALKMLKSKLYEKELSDRRKKQDGLYADKGDIAWGNQIRSYVYQPYTMVKDHRTNYQTGNILAVMDGAIDPFIEVYLNHFHKKK